MDAFSVVVVVGLSADIVSRYHVLDKVEYNHINDKEND